MIKTINGCFKKTGVLLLSALLAFTFLSCPVFPVLAAKSETQLQAEVERLEKEQKRLEKELNKLKNDEKKQKEYQSTLIKQISSMEQQAETIETQIAAYDTNIQTKEKEIEDKTANIDKNYDRMKERLAARQLAGDTSLLAALFTAEDFTDFLTRAEMLQAAAEQDSTLISQLGAEKEKLETAKSELQRNRNQMKESQTLLDNKRAYLAAAYQQSEVHMADIRAEAEAYRKDKERIDREEAEAQQELDDFYKTHQSAGTVTAGEWGCPFPAKNRYVSSKYGPRPSLGDYHKGVDISCSGGSFGKDIVASKAGTVIKTVKTSPKKGYGNYIIIDHGKGKGGNGYTTLYAHCSQVLVNVGQPVKQGQVIGKVGNTGNSTGPHLHFEVRINGKHQNPMDYIKV